MPFASLGLAEPILRAVGSQGYAKPTPIQSEAIPSMLEGRDLLGCAQTGTGKTAAFALPLLHRLMGKSRRERGFRPIRVLVLSPTRELAGQISESFRTYGQHTGLRETVIFGGVGQHPQVRHLQRGVDILTATPGRLLDLMQQGYVDLRNVETFVLDEADRMLDMGFMPDVRRIIKSLPIERQTVMFSATMPAPIEQLADAILRDPIRIRIEPPKRNAESIRQTVCFVPRKAKPTWLTGYLSREGVGRVIVFTRTKHGADRVTKHLNKSDISADAIHGDKSQSARQRALANFKSNEIGVLVATDIAARGIDVEGVSHVINYDIPHEPETYIHRIGRTGRAGASGIAVSLCDHEERDNLAAIERLLRKRLLVERRTSTNAGHENAAASNDESADEAYFDEPLEAAVMAEPASHRRVDSPRKRENGGPKRYKSNGQKSIYRGAGPGRGKAGGRGKASGRGKTAEQGHSNDAGQGGGGEQDSGRSGREREYAYGKKKKSGGQRVERSTKRRFGTHKPRKRKAL